MTIPGPPPRTISTVLCLSLSKISGIIKIPPQPPDLMALPWFTPIGNGLETFPGKKRY